jgi:putative membrane protein
LTRILFSFRKEGCLETVGPAGLSSPLHGGMPVLTHPHRHECNVPIGEHNGRPSHIHGEGCQYPDTNVVYVFLSFKTHCHLFTPKTDGIHLKQCVTLYLFALPLSLVQDLGWAVVPIVTIVAFTFMGIEGIAEEIEMPFGMFCLLFFNMAVFKSCSQVTTVMIFRWVCFSSSLIPGF